LTEADRLYVPEFCLLECTNVLWKQVRFHKLPVSEAERLTTDLVGLPLTIVPVTGMLPRALEIGLAHQLAIYDSMYIALAENSNTLSSQ
jgi:predicted nucleic acid-binding protein